VVFWQVRVGYNMQENITRKAQPISYGGGGGNQCYVGGMS
jgi:hypothetical protein